MPTPRPDPAAACSEPHYLNRELSWVAFNERVLEEALDPANPVLERLRFLTIFHANLDEFFMIRVSGLRQQVTAGVELVSRDGHTPRQQLHDIREQLTTPLARAETCLRDEILPALRLHGVELVHYDHLDSGERKHWDKWCLDNVYPVLTPLAVGPTHPFPFISNLSLNLAVMVESPVTGERRLARIKVPSSLPRLIAMEQGSHRHLLLEELVAANLKLLFPGMLVDQPWLFRVIRDADFDIREDEADDLMIAIEERLRRRRFGNIVHCVVQRGMPDVIRDTLITGLDVHPSEVQEADMLGVSELATLCSLDLPELKYPPFVPAVPAGLHDEQDLFAAIRAGDLMVHHPFDSFGPVVDFVRTAAHDPRVVAIKQTLYRTGGSRSPIVAALLEAVENGKQVAAIIELKARFDEANNIVWARRLEEAGVHVVYGVQGLKTHAKMCLVVREEGGKRLRRYAHIGTGNYNADTARVYTDLGLFTANKKLCADVADVFNQLTGFSQPPAYRRLLVAPTHLKQPLLDLIGLEIDEALAGRPAQLIVKCNAITDGTVIDALYAASQAGVRCELIVRGICCLIPGRPGLSENIRVRSLVGRFLEHSRVYWFHHAGTPKVFIGSADWMPRNLDRRVEVLTPIESPPLIAWLRDHYLERYLNDTGRTRVMRADGTYRRLDNSDANDVHAEFLADLE